MSLSGWAAIILGGLATIVLGLVAAPRSRPCRPCAGLGTMRGAGGRWAGHCDRCRGSGRRDTWTARLLVRASRGRVLPPAGSAADGRMHGPGFVFRGRSTSGAWRAAPDPADTRLHALEHRRVPARRRVVERREAQRGSARGPALLVAVVRVWLARAALRRAQRAAERHAEDIDARAAGYRRMAGTGRDRHRRR